MDDTIAAPRLRLVAVAVIGNEADIVDAWLDHHLPLLDALLVVSHGSRDGTRERIAARASAGAPILLMDARAEAFRQSAILTQVVHMRAPQVRPDWIFALDADEFLVTESRAALDAELARVPRGMTAHLRWRTYLPPRPGEDPLLERATRRLVEEPGNQPKVAFPAAMGMQPQVQLCEGNHWLANMAGGRMALVRAQSLETAWLAHLPVRSAAQIAAKVQQGERAIRPVRAPGASTAWHWAMLSEQLEAGRVLDDAALEEIALRYYAFAGPTGPGEPPAAVATCEDPIRPERHPPAH